MRATRKCLLLGTHILSILNRIIPKDDNQILIHDTMHDSLVDNSEALYDYMVETGLVNRYKVVVYVPMQKGVLPYTKYIPVGTIKGLWAFLRSKYVFFSFGDLRILPAPSQIVVNQWHGGITKRFGKGSGLKFYDERMDNFTYCLSTAEMFVPYWAKMWGCREEQVLVQGMARIDQFFSEHDGLKCLGINTSDYNKVVLWMPTFRESIDNRYHDADTSANELSFPIFTTYESIERLNAALSEQNVLLVLKIHPFAKFTAPTESYSHIRVVRNPDILKDGTRLYEFVKEFDALISDYSSIFYDYMVLDRPMAFTRDDVENYKEHRGWALDLDELQAGDRLYTEQDFFSFIKNVADGVDTFKDERQQRCAQCNKYTDNHNCERLCKTLGII